MSRGWPVRLQNLTPFPVSRPPLPFLQEIIRNVRKLEEEEWLEGELNGRRRMFPDNFVKEINERWNPRITICPSNRKGMEMQ